MWFSNPDYQAKLAEKFGEHEKILSAERIKRNEENLLSDRSLRKQ